jgi:hypothetical protein
MGMTKIPLAQQLIIIRQRLMMEVPPILGMTKQRMITDLRLILVMDHQRITVSPPSIMAVLRKMEINLLEEALAITGVLIQLQVGPDV